jgi:hypothetical protein
MDQNNSSFLALVSEHAVSDGTLTEEDVRGIQIKLWNLLAERTQRYTMGESSSVSVETAEELWKSICFSIGLYLKMVGGQSVLLLKTAQLPQLLRASWTEIEAQVEKAKVCLQRVRDGAPDIVNRSYRDTLIGMEAFFKKYDYRFFAHEIPGDIDYQLCHAVPQELQGIEYINEYLRRLSIENDFCGYFERGTMIALLESYCKDYQGLLINLYEPVAVNALGLALLGGDILALEITDRDRSKLLSRLTGYTKTEVLEELKRAAEVLCYRLQIGDAQARDYLQSTATELFPRIKAAMPKNRLDGIFLSLFRQAG